MFYRIHLGVWKVPEKIKNILISLLNETNYKWCICLFDKITQYILLNLIKIFLFIFENFAFNIFTIGPIFLKIIKIQSLEYWSNDN